MGGVGVAISSSKCSSSPFLGQKIVTKTSRGLIPHITRDHLDSIPVSCVEFPLEGLLEGDLFSSNDSPSLIKVLPEYREMKRFLSLRNGITCITKNTISFATSSGIKKISWIAFANAIKSLGINCLLAPIAPAFSESSRKATEKTMGLLNCLLSNLSIDIWAPIHDSLMESPNYQHILLQKNQIIAGYWLEAGNKGLGLSKLPNENAQIYLAGCTSLAEMNAWSLEFQDRIFLENSYASMLTEEGSALTTEGKTICLWDSQFHADQKPICSKEDCPCFTCQKHSRCYLQHLLTVNEMLGWTLLAIHNETMLRLIILKNKPKP